MHEKFPFDLKPLTTPPDPWVIQFYADLQNEQDERDALERKNLLNNLNDAMTRFNQEEEYYGLGLYTPLFWPDPFIFPPEDNTVEQDQSPTTSCLSPSPPPPDRQASSEAELDVPSTTIYSPHGMVPMPGKVDSSLSP